MRSFRGYKASTLPAWVGNRGLAAYYNASLSQTVEELRRAGTDGCPKLAHDDTVSGKFCLKTRDWRHSRGVTTFSAGGSGRSSSKRKDPSFLLGAGWEAGGEDVTVAVWWDFENCNVPLGIEVYKVGVNIVSGLRMCGFKGPVSISAYGDTLQLSRSTQEALASTGIQLHHIPSGGKDSSDRALLVDLILWTFDHPPPAHLFLISGDRDFSNALHRLRMMNYNILLACPAGTIVSPALLGAASQVWQWNSLVRGEGLHFVNLSPESKPPDGPSGGGIAARQTTQKPYSPSSLHPGSRGPDGGGPLVDVGGKPNLSTPSPSSIIRTKAAAVKAMHNEQQGSIAAADSTRSTKATIEQEAPKALKPAQVNTNYPLKVPQIPAVEIKEETNLPEEFEITSSSTEMPPETRSADRQIPLPQSAEDPTLQPKESERPMKKGVQLSEMSAVASAQMEKSDQRDSHAVGEKAPSPRLHSFMSKLISMFRRPRKDQGVDRNSSFHPQGGSSTADKAKVGSSDLDQKKMICSTASVKVEDRADNIESGGVVADGILHKPLVNDSKHRFSVSDGGFKEMSGAVCGEGAGREKLGGQQSTVFVDEAQRKRPEFAWKTWLFGPAQEKSASSVTGGPLADSSKSPSVYDMTDLDKITWKELLSWPGKLTQTSTGSKSELSANTSHHGVIGREDEARMRDSTSSSPIEGHKLKEEKASSGSNLKDLKDYLRTPEGTAILLEARDLVEVVDTLKTTGPNKFRGLQSSQIADLIHELETTKEGSNHRYLTAPVAYSVRASNEGLADQLRTRSAGQSTEIVGHQVSHTIDESSLPKEQGENVNPRFEDKESPNGSMHDELLSNHFVDIRSLSNNGISILKQEDQIRNLEDDSVPLRVSNSIEDSSLDAKMLPITSLSKTEVSGPSFLEFQEWFVETVKEAYKSSERTRRIGFDLSLVKPDFEREFGIRLDPRVYGFVKLQDLVASISAVRVTRPRNDMCVVYLLKEAAILEEDQRGEITVSTLKASRWPQMYHDCKSLVRELMMENPDGLPGTKLKPMFMSRFQYPLDHKHAGYQKMSDLLRLMPDVVSVSGKYLVPSEELFLSLKNEAKGEEIEVNREVIVEEDSVSSDTSLSKQAAKLAKVGFESTEGWGEIDTEGNGNSSPSAYVIEATPGEVPGPQDENAYRSGIIEKVPFTENVPSQYLVPAETTSGGETNYLQRLSFPTDVQGPSVDEFGQELLYTEPRENHKVKENASLESCLLSGEPLLNAIKVKCETDKDSRDEQEPPISFYESREGHQVYQCDDDKDTYKKEEELFVEKNQDGSVHIDEGLELSPGTVILGDSNADVIDEHIKVASGNVPKVEPEIMGSFGALGSVDQETAAESPPSSLDDTSADVVTVVLETDVDFTQTQESDVSQSMEKSEGRDETSNTRNISSGLELANETSGEKHTSNKESVIDFEESTGHSTLDTVLKAGPSTDKNSPKETINLDDNANISPGSLLEDRKKGFEGLVSDGPLDKELETSSSIEECQTSAGVSKHDEERPPKVGEATDEGHTEGHSSGSVSSDRQSLKSIWKRLFS